jgi:hypothetical protein
MHILQQSMGFIVRGYCVDVDREPRKNVTVGHIAVFGIIASMAVIKAVMHIKLFAVKSPATSTQSYCTFQCWADISRIRRMP